MAAETGIPMSRLWAEDARDLASLYAVLQERADG